MEELAQCINALRIQQKRNKQRALKYIYKSITIQRLFHIVFLHVMELFLILVVTKQLEICSLYYSVTKLFYKL